MGNRAILKAKGNNSKAIYLHWNGGRDSVEAFLKYCELRGFRGFETDYGMARFCQVVGNFFGADGLSIGIIDITDTETGEWMDNGMYVIEGWKIVERRGFIGEEQNEYDLEGMLIAIDSRQPEQQRLGEYLQAKEVLTKDLKVGDVIYHRGIDGTFEKRTVVGIGDGKIVNGIKTKGIPYIDLYGVNGDYSNNPNNYIDDEKVKIAS